MDRYRLQEDDFIDMIDIRRGSEAVVVYIIKYIEA